MFISLFTYNGYRAIHGRLRYTRAATRPKTISETVVISAEASQCSWTASADKTNHQNSKKMENLPYVFICHELVAQSVQPGSQGLPSTREDPDNEVRLCTLASQSNLFTSECQILKPKSQHGSACSLPLFSLFHAEW